MTKAAELREQALAKLTEARDLAGDDEVKAEDQERFNALMDEFRELDGKAAKAATTDDNMGTLRERMEWYTVKATGQAIPFSVRSIPRPEGRSMGAAFVESTEYRDLVESGALSSDRAAFKSKPFQAAASDVIQSTPSTGPGSALVTPDYLPGIVPLPQRPLTVRDLFSQGTTNSDTVSYAQQTKFESGAAAVAQAVDITHGAKPQSSLHWVRKTSTVETIANWMAVTRQQLADAGQVRALIDNQLGLMLQLEEEEQLLNGNGTSPNLSGILDQAGVQTLDLTGASSNGDPNLDGIRNAMRLVKTGAARAVADFVVVNPVDSMEFDLLTDQFGHYRVGDPYAYDASGGAGAQPQRRPLWGLRRVETEAMDIGKALVGAGKIGATVLERQGITILTADQHADFFIRNLVVVLAEERLGFPIFFPSAFVDITLATWSDADAYISGGVIS